MANFSVQIMSAFVEASALHDDSILCYRLEVGTWLSDSNSTVSAPSTVGCLTERGFQRNEGPFSKHRYVFDLYRGLPQPIDQQKITQRFCGIP